MSDLFDQPVSIRLNGGKHTVATASEAAELLASVDWPGERGPTHRDAYETCLKVLDGHRSAVDGRKRFVEVAGQAGVLTSD